MEAIIPRPTFPEYRMTLVWRSDRDGNGIRVYLIHTEPNKPVVMLQSSFHPNLDLHQAVTFAMQSFFGPEKK